MTVRKAVKLALGAIAFPVACLAICGIALVLVRGCVGGCLGWLTRTRMIQRKTVWASNGKKIEIRAYCGEMGVPWACYEVTDGDRVVVPETLCYDYGESGLGKLQFSVLVSRRSETVGVVESSSPNVVLALHDFSTGESWPFKTEYELDIEREERGRRLLDRLRTDYPYLTDVFPTFNKIQTFQGPGLGEIHIHAEAHWEDPRELRYTVTRDGEQVVPQTTFLWVYSEMSEGGHSFSLICSGGGRYVGVVEDRRPNIVLILHDFVTQESWPFKAARESRGEPSDRRGRLLGMLQADHPGRTYVMEGVDYPIAEFPVSEERRIAVYGSTLWEGHEWFSYVVTDSAQTVVPRMDFLDIPEYVLAPRPSFSLVKSHETGLVALIEEADPELLHVLHDFESGESWPYLPPEESLRAWRQRGARLLARWQTRHPDTRYRLNEERYEDWKQW